MRFIQEQLIAESRGLLEELFTAVFTWVTWTLVLPRLSYGVTNNMRFKLSSDAEYAFTCGKRKLSLNLISQKKIL